MQRYKTIKNLSPFLACNSESIFLTSSSSPLTCHKYALQNQLQCKEICSSVITSKCQNCKNFLTLLCWYHKICSYSSSGCIKEAVTFTHGPLNILLLSFTITHSPIGYTFNSCNEELLVCICLNLRKNDNSLNQCVMFLLVIFLL